MNDNATYDDEIQEDELVTTFRRLSDQWKRETAPLSSVSQIAKHPAYQRIIGMGECVIPLILKDLQESPHHWFWALSELTNESPIPTEARGNMKAMTKAWLEWGKRNRYIE